MKVEIFIGPKIKKKIEEHVFSTKLNSTGKGTWKTFENVCRNSEILQEQISSYSAVGCDMSLKLRFQHCHLGFFLKI
jgi:hypothetical protein